VTVSVLSVATHGYLSHWSSLLGSIEQNFFLEHSVTAHVFTNDIDQANRLRPKSDRVKVEIHQVPDWGWPEATLLRFRAISEYASSIEGDITCWLDADMLVMRPTGAELDARKWKSGLAFVHHPGFWRPSGWGITASWPEHPTVIPNDVLWLAKGRPILGAWESDPKSRAFVAPEQRQTYVCGGAWFGETDRVLQMAEVLSQRTDEDLAEGLIAKWHDESHVNWYLAHNEATVLGPEYCYEETYPRLKGVNPRIKAVDKGRAVQKERAVQR